MREDSLLQRREFAFAELDSAFEGFLWLVIKNRLMHAAAILFFLTSIVVAHVFLAKADVCPEITRWRDDGLKSHAVFQRVKQRVAVLALLQEVRIGINASEFAVCVNRMRDEDEGADEEEEFHDEQL